MQSQRRRLCSAKSKVPFAKHEHPKHVPSKGSFFMKEEKNKIYFEKSLQLLFYHFCKE
jgi:hypothetical protein